MSLFDSLTALGFAVVLGVVHFFSEQIRLPEGKPRWRIISLGAGICIGYLILHLLPETYQEAAFLKQWVFLALLAGFAFTHLAEKYAYKHAKRAKLVHELKIIRLVVFFLYYIVVGISLADKVETGILDGVMFLVPIAIHTALSTSALARIHGRVKESIAVKLLMSVSSLLGVALAIIVPIPPIVDSFLTSFIAGVLLYVFVKEFLPEERKGEPFFFILGIIIFLAYTLAAYFFKFPGYPGV